MLCQQVAIIYKKLIVIKKKMMETMGLVVIKSILFTVDSPAMLENEYYVQEKIKTDVQYVIQCIKNKKII